MNIHPIIYLDYNATTPVAPEVMNAMLPYYLTAYGNPSSNDHLMGWQAKESLEEARRQLAASLCATTARTIFTAGATESINLILRGLRVPGKNHIITVKTEHKAVLDTCEELAELGYRITKLEVNEDGLIDLNELEKAIDVDTLLVTIMWVNNETGVIQPIEKIGTLCQKHGVPFMTDATQAIGKLKISLDSLPIDILLGSAHKIYGPKGVGFLTVKKDWGKYLQPIITGGGQEGRKRAGTINLPGIVGLSKAVALAYEIFEEDRTRILSLRDRFERTLKQELAIKINGSPDHRLYNTSNLCFLGHDSERIMQAIGGKVAASRGSACSTARVEPSHVLASMGLSDEDSHASIRFSFGRYTTEKEIEKAVAYMIAALSD